MSNYEKKLIEIIETHTDIIISDVEMLEYIDEDVLIEAEVRAYGIELAWSDMLNGYFN
jgi:hypothetical protein